MEIRMKEKTCGVPWEYILAPMLLALALGVLLYTNLKNQKAEWVNVEDAVTSSQIPGSGASDAPDSVMGPCTETEAPLPDKGQGLAPPLEAADGRNAENRRNETPAASVVNINKASMEELMALPYIGEVKARAIIEYRSKNGPFKNVEDLLKIKGIGPKTLEKLKPFATV